MQIALETHKELFDTYDHRIEVRRIHLGRNLAKILSSSNRMIEAFELSTRLIKYTVTDINIWPLECCKVENPNIISSEAKMFVINQLVSELINILSQIDSSEIMTIFYGLISHLKKNLNKESKLVLNWCNAYSAVLNDKKIAFLKNAKSFFQNPIPPTSVIAKTQ